MTTNVVLFALLVALQVADAATTIRIIQRGGHELNPLLNRFMSNLGVRVALLVSRIGLWMNYCEEGIRGDGTR